MELVQQLRKPSPPLSFLLNLGATNRDWPTDLSANDWGKTVEDIGEEIQSEANEWAVKPGEPLR